MTQLPPDELAALPEHIAPGTLVLELGNKKNSTGLYRDWYMEQGLDYMCVDWNGEDGAIPVDMRGPGMWTNIGAGSRFEIVTNFGFTEHVGETLEEQIECWRNVHELVEVGGALAICMPLMPYWKGHGRWMPTVEWYLEMADLNHYAVLFTRVWKRVRPTFVSTMVKQKHVEFLEPDEDIIRSDL